MRNVYRVEEPEVLKQNACHWTEELLTAISIARKKGGKVKQNLWTRYNNGEIRDRLNAIYSGLCCYCESRIGDVAWEHIEHRKPKKLFPKLTFCWGNLHLACPKCNTYKSNKWDSVNEILDAAKDHPISDHLRYKISSTDVIRDPVSNRGAVTVCHAKLNRPELLETRLKVFLNAYETVSNVRCKEKTEGDSPIVKVLKSELRKLFSGEHGSVIEFVARRMLNNIV